MKLPHRALLSQIDDYRTHSGLRTKQNLNDAVMAVVRVLHLALIAVDLHVTPFYKLRTHSVSYELMFV